MKELEGEKQLLGEAKTIEDALEEKKVQLENERSFCER